MITITSLRDGFRRCGVVHPAVPTSYPEGVFSEEQLLILEAEPMLLVQRELPMTEEQVSEPEGRKEPATTPEEQVSEPEGRKEPATTTEEPPRSSAAETIARIKKAGWGELDGYWRGENRKSVLRAIEERMAELGDPDELRDAQ